MFKFIFLLSFTRIFAFEYLDKAEESFLKQHKTQTKVVEVKDKVWPKVTIKAIVDSSPINSAAIFSAFDYQQNYIPDMTMSKVIKQPNTNEVHVYYELDMPWPVSKGIYTNGHKFFTPKEGEFKVTWYSIKSDIAEDLHGSAHFIPYKNKTLLIYQTHVDPKSFFAGIFKKIMVKDVEKNLKIIINTIETKQKDEQFLKKYTKKLQNALTGIASY